MPTISVTRSPWEVVAVEFTGTLQTAPSVAGPWTDVAGESSLFFTIGAVIHFGVFTDFAIRGEGYFIVKNVQTGELFANQTGEFRTDINGFLVTNGGLRVQGFEHVLIFGQTEYADFDP